MSQLLEHTFKIINAQNYEEFENQNLLRNLINVQTDHLYDESVQQESFLVTVWTIKEINGLIAGGSTFYILIDSYHSFIGYIITSKIEEFTKQLNDTSNTFNIEQLKDLKAWIYIHQIVVEKSFLKMGIGTLLIDHVLKVYRDYSFVSDYMINPKINLSSSKLFEKKHFIKSGILNLTSYRGFKPSSWQIVTFQ